MSLKGGCSPSTWAVPVRGKNNRLAAKERVAAKERSADHRRVKAEMAAAREGGGTDRARHLASNRTSALQRSPISRAMTVSLQRLDLHSSGYVRPFGSSCKAAPAVRLVWEAGSSNRGDERGVDCKLGAAPERQAIGDDRNASVVLASWAPALLQYATVYVFAGGLPRNTMPAHWMRIQFCVMFKNHLTQSALVTAAKKASRRPCTHGRCLCVTSIRLQVTRRWLSHSSAHANGNSSSEWAACAVPPQPPCPSNGARRHAAPPASAGVTALATRVHEPWPTAEERQQFRG